MKIAKLKIENFKTLENVTVNFDGYFSSISGKNNAGKTSVIQCILSGPLHVGAACGGPNADLPATV